LTVLFVGFGSDDTPGERTVSIYTGIAFLI